MKNSLKRAVAFAVVAVMLLCMAPFVYAADFASSVSSAKAAPGQTVSVDVKIDSMPYEAIGCYAVAVKFDTDVFSYKGFVPGSMLLNPNSDLIISNETNPDEVLVSFTSDATPITEAGTVITINFEVADNASNGTYDITLIPSAKLQSSKSETFISRDDLADYLMDGTITVSDGNEVSVTKLVLPSESGSAAVGESWNNIVKNVLPSSAEALLSNGETAKFDITWTKPEAFSSDKEGEYPITGVVSASGYPLDAGVKTNVVYSLKIAQIKDITIVSSEKAFLSVNPGVSVSVVVEMLPKTVKVTADTAWNNGSKTGNWEVSWTSAGSNYKSAQAGDYTFVGTLLPKDGYIIDTIPSAVVTVKSSQAQSGKPGNPSGNPILNALISDDDEDEVEIRFVIGGSSFTMNNMTSYMDVQFMYNEAGDRTLVPVRFISEVLGYNVDWNGETQNVTITKDDRTIVLTIGSETMYSNGAAVQMDTAPVIYSDRTFVPIRFVAENFGLTVGFDEQTQEVTLTSN